MIALDDGSLDSYSFSKGFCCLDQAGDLHLLQWHLGLDVTLTSGLQSRGQALALQNTCLLGLHCTAILKNLSLMLLKDEAAIGKP